MKAMDNIRDRYGDGYPKTLLFGVGTFGAINREKSKLFKKNKSITEV